MTRKLFDTQQQIIIASEYQTGIGLRELARKYNCDRDAIKTALRYQSVDVRLVSNNNRYTVNHNAFDDYTEESCYWLGFLYADGSTNNKSLSLTLKQSDFDHVEKFKSFIQSGAPITYGINNCSNGKKYRRCSIIITSRHLVSQLHSNGIVSGRPNPDAVFGKIPNHMFHHWLRGLFDGDGCAYTSPHKGINFLGDKILLELIHSRLLDVGADDNTTRKIQRHSKSDIYYLCYPGRRVAYKVINYLYQDATVWLERKRQTITSWPNPQQSPRNTKNKDIVLAPNMVTRSD